MTQTWIVLLEAAGGFGSTVIGDETLAALVDVMDCGPIVSLHTPDRHALQFQIVSTSPADALFVATARWAYGVRTLGLRGWSLQRLELVTPEEFDREAAATVVNQSVHVEVEVGDGGGDLLRGAFHDSLTGLATPALFRDRVHEIMDGGRLSDSEAALVVVDIDGLAGVNGDLGFQYGDEVLVAVAGRITRQASSIWAAARLAGDEFALVVDDSAGSAETVAAQLLDDIRVPIVIRGQPILITASVGIASLDVDSDVDGCLVQAGTAMCAAKDAGGDRYRWYSPGLAVDGARLDFVAQTVPDRLAYLALLERAVMVANECSSLEKAAAVVLRQVLVHTGWLFGHLWLVDATVGRLAPAGVWQASGRDGLDRLRRHVENSGGALGEGLPGMAWQTGRPQWAQLTGSEPRCAYQEAAAAAGVSAAVAFPVLAGTEVVAVLGFGSARPVTSDDPLFDVIVSVAAQLGRVFERTRAADALAEAEERCRRLAATSPAMIWTSGTGGESALFEAWQFHTAKASDIAVSGREWSSRVHPDDLSRWKTTYLDAFGRREPFQLEYRSTGPDGRYRTMVAIGNPAFDGDDFLGYHGRCVDVSDFPQRRLDGNQSDRANL